MRVLEFEQKFVLDVRCHEQIRKEMAERLATVSYIRQFYDKEGGRYRCTHGGIEDKDTNLYVLETKKGIKIGTAYSITQESDVLITADEFESGWEKNRSRRLQKIRYTIPGRYPGHKIMIDVFYSNDEKNVYAVVAEGETLLTPDTTTLYLHFSLPIYLERFRLLTVDDSDPDMKVFKSANMVDQPESIEAVKKAISRLYD